MQSFLKTKDYKHFKVVTDSDPEKVVFETCDIADVSGLFNEDVVELTSDNTIKLIERNPLKLRNIVGILNTCSKTKQGIDKKGHMLYLFKPFDCSFPEFIVASKLNNQQHNHWVLVDYLDWKDKRPRGAIVHMFGSVGDYAVEKKALIKHYRPYVSSPKSYIEEVNVIKQNHLNGTWKTGRMIVSDYTVSMDPDGCKDVDDAFSLTKMNDNVYRLGIHISDVSCWIEPGGILDKNASTLGATLYHGDDNLPMWSKDLSDDLFSLLEECDRPALSVFLEYDISTGGVLNVTNALKTIVRNRKQLTYSRNSYIEEKNINWETLETIVHALRRQMSFKMAQDSHEWIETLMIYYNIKIAEGFGENGIYRNQMTRTPDERPECSVIPPKLAFLQWDSANYSLYSSMHECLGLKKYTHATSPIRRYADYLVQKIINDNAPISQTTLCNLNKLQKKDKKFYRDLIYLNSIHNNEEQIINVILLEDSIETKFNVFIEEWNCQIKINIPGANDGGVVRLFKRFECIKLKYYIDPHSIQWKQRIVFQIINA
jgi:exoribonuclease R